LIRFDALVLPDARYHLPWQTHLISLEGGSMNNSTSATHGIELLVEKCRNEFRRRENINYYAQEDYKEAERKYIKFCLNGNSDY
jgi:hypothetical protein